MKAKKSLGQHFLKSEKALRSIIDAGEVKESDTILEIGPGTGALTERLLPLALKVIAVEKDNALSAELRERFPNLTLVHGDILDFAPPQTQYKLIANIPYNITGAILQKFLSAEHQPERMVLLVQKEVAERIVARDGKESILSISVKVYGKPEYVERVLAGSFAPAPKVDSAIIAVKDISKRFFEGFSEESFFEMLRLAFSSKRKKLSSNLGRKYSKEAVSEAVKSALLGENSRAEEVGVERWQKLAKILCV